MIDINNLKEGNFKEKVIEEKGIVLVEFWAPWCKYCGMMEGVLVEIVGKYKEKIKVYKLNVDEGLAIASKYNVRSLPTLLLFKDGEVKETIVGFRPKEEVEDKIEKYI